MLKRESALPPVRSFGKGQGAIFALKIAVTLGCFWYLYRHIDFTALRRTLPGFEVRWAVLTVVLITLQIPLIALRWLEIVRVLDIKGERLTYARITLASAIGQFFSQILPFVAGDGVRVWFLTHYGSDWRDATVSVVIDRCIGIGILLAFAFAILFLPSSLNLFGGYRGDVLGLLGAMLLVGLLALVLGPRLSAVFAEQRYARWISIFFAGSQRAVFGPRGAIILGAACLIHLLTIAAVWSLGQAQGLALSPADAAVLFAVMVGVMLLPFSIGGWGLREFAMVSLFGNYGLTPEHALVFSMYFGVACVIASLPGAVAWFVYLIPRSGSSSSPTLGPKASK
jgi:glycosyltransferase 2 family protein